MGAVHRQRDTHTENSTVAQQASRLCGPVVARCHEPEVTRNAYGYEQRRVFR